MQQFTKNTLLLLIIFLVVVGAGLVYYLYWNDFYQTPKEQPVVEEPIPLVDEDKEDELADQIRIYEPVTSQTVASPLLIRGQARGTWFFEATFPVMILDSEGNELAVGYASTSDEWMTEDFVYFDSVITFDVSGETAGTLVLKKANPSGLPEYDEELRVQINFQSANGAPTVTNFLECARAGYPVMESYPRQCRTPGGQTYVEEIEQDLSDCRPTGCSSQVCADEDVITTCEYRPEYACYASAVCERQLNGECGWTMTEELANCLSRYEEE